jgi:hypothetical protein
MTRFAKATPFRLARLPLRLEWLEDRTVPATFTVTNLDDAGAGSLRQAILDANAAAGADDILFAPAITGGTITLVTSLPEITDTLTITGPGFDGITVSGNNAVRVFSVKANVTAALSGLAVINGKTAENGGGILNNGNLTLTNVTLRGNSAAGGGAVANVGATAKLAVVNSTLTQNTAESTGGGAILNTTAGALLTVSNSTISSNNSNQGGGIRNGTGATATITDTIVTNNQGVSSGDGAGIRNDGTMTLTNSTVSFNIGRGSSFFGGGIRNDGSLSLTGSSVYGNLSEGRGGGIRSTGAVLNIVNSTIANNTALASLGGGGIRVDGTGNLSLLNSTVTGNADASGSATNAGGIAFDGTTFTMSNTIVAQNVATGAGAPPDIRGTVAAGSVNNLVGIGTAALLGITNGLNGNQIGTAASPINPLLGPLQDNGGPTLTRAPLPGSPVINAGSNAAAAGLATDQRGFLRVVGPTVDIGAVEFQPPGVAVTITSSDNPALAGRAVTFTATVAPSAAGPNNPPTGSVAFVIDGTTAATVPLAADGTATFTTTTLAPGTHEVRAEYLGDANFATAAAILSPAQVVNLPLEVLVGVPNFAAGPDAGGGPSVVYYNPDGTAKFSLTVFDKAFTGGVRVAVADFNGDGVPDIAVGTGPGAATLVRVFDGKTKAELFSIQPFEASFTGGVFVAAGDVTGDGKADLIITPDEGGGPRARVFSGNGFAQVSDFFGIEDPDFRGGARAAVGDVNGDGIGDLLVAAGFGGGPRIAVFNGKSLAAVPVKLFADFFVFEQTLRNGVFISSGDLNGDGFAEVIAGGGPGGGPRIFALSGKALLGGTETTVANFFAGNVENRGGVRVTVKDLDGDAQADLVVGDGTGAGSRVTAYLGKNVPADGTPPEHFSFDAFPGFDGGVFVG